ncbi:diguanylate cyclase domain-containing protein [Ectopseudomonas chengduensis]|jgi:diguanylate cyclase (GGDEF)-like protein|nr:diguanylate cyclase [Pseudomonas sp. WS 5019]NMY15641.1 GGDEF domain-containing protein [Pseudomonas sp. WS 5019]
MHSAPEALRAIPENRYAEQLRRGFRFLRFSQPLEQEYHQYISKVQARYQKIAVLLGLGIWMIFSLVDALRLDLWQRFPDYPAALWGLLLVRGSIIFTLCLLALLLLNGSRKHYGPQVVTVTLLSLVLGTTLTIIFYQNLSVPISNSVLLLMAITLFFPLGLSFRGNLLLAAASLPLVVAPGLWLLSETQHVDHLRLCFIFSLALLICAMGAYVRDHTQREQFLLLQLLDWQANHDPLTALHNRRSFTQHLDLVLRQANRESAKVALLMLDIDHFKRFNDHYGHQAGDDALRQVGRLLQNFARRPMDMAVRLGGEEFALLLYDCDAEQLQTLGEALRSGLATLNIAHAASPTADHLTVSMGARLAMDGESSEELYRQVDDLLYQAKQAGRNQLTLG